MLQFSAISESSRTCLCSHNNFSFHTTSHCAPRTCSCLSLIHAFSNFPDGHLRLHILFTKPLDSWTARSTSSWGLICSFLNVMLFSPFPIRVPLKVAVSLTGLSHTETDFDVPLAMSTSQTQIIAVTRSSIFAQMTQQDSSQYEAMQTHFGRSAWNFVGTILMFWWALLNCA